MIIIDLLAYLATACILLAYVNMTRGGLFGSRIEPVLLFDLANGIGCIPIGLSAILHGAFPALAITLAFGVIGWYGVYKYWDWCRNNGFRLWETQ